MGVIKAFQFTLLRYFQKNSSDFSELNCKITEIQDLYFINVHHKFSQLRVSSQVSLNKKPQTERVLQNNQFVDLFFS